MSKKNALLILILTAMIVSAFFLINRNQLDGYIIITRVSVEDYNVSVETIDYSFDLNNAEIVLFNPEKPTSKTKLLTRNFASAVLPDLSPDSRRIVFAGKKESDSHWQIWMMSLKGSKVVQITDGNRDCFDPVFLPDNSITFSCSWDHDRFGAGSTLYTLNAETNQKKPITFHPHYERSATMLHDGRILWVSEQLYPTAGSAELLAIRPDGTNAGLFNQITAGYKIRGKARESSDHHIFYAGQENTAGGKHALFRFAYNNPFVSTEKLFTSREGSIHSLYPIEDHSVLLSYRENRSVNYGIYQYNRMSGNVEAIFSRPDYHFFDPIAVNRQPFVPKKLPTSLNYSMETGIMVFIEAENNHNTDNPYSDNLIQVYDINGLNKEFTAASDGSFFIEVTAKMPILFQQINEEGGVMNGPYTWVWVMPGERRGFTGWDKNQWITPANRVPEAINRPPTLIKGDESASIAGLHKVPYKVEESDE